MDANGQPPLNVRFIFEGEEECGGRVVFDLLRAEPERTRADAVLVCDSSFYAPGWPAASPRVRLYWYRYGPHDSKVTALSLLRCAASLHI